MTALTPERERVILESVRRGTPVTQAALAAGIASETLRRWKLIADGAEQWPGTESPVDPESRSTIVAFVQRLSQAQAEAMQVLVSKLWTNATTPNRTTGWFDTQAADKILSKHPAYRADWREHRQVSVELSGTVDPQLRAVEQLPTPELLALAPPEYADLVDTEPEPG